ncbi:hypothetical protein [Microbacterium sp. KR10-403]|uniref:hypothetical protein n=1 Tax=Microbacterium sp. KR10-403 TaxID=3158581 RepID=UPI0032E4AD22
MAHRHIASREEVFFFENGQQFGNGVVITRFENGNVQVQLPIVYERTPSQWINVKLMVRPGDSVTSTFGKFLDTVEFEPEDSYIIVGTEEGKPVIDVLSTERYARLRAALGASERIVAEQLPEAPTSSNGDLLKVLKERANG